MKNHGPLKKERNSGAMTPIERQMHKDLRWAMAHHEELERQYPGESVVVWRQQVLAHGTNEEELLRQAATAEHPRDQLVIVEFPVFFESPR